MKIIIYSNCIGFVLEKMFLAHNCTVIYIANHEYINKSLDTNMIELLENCDAFLYVPFTTLTLMNGERIKESDYSIANLIKYLKPECITIRLGFYRFKGFWYESTYKPYSEYKNYSFLDWKNYGIHNSFNGFNGTKQEVVDKINNITIDKEKFLTYFREELEKFKKIDDTSDVKMYDFLINNYKTKHLFHDVVHPTNIFFYEIFRQIIFILTNYELNIDDPDFIDICEERELTHWSVPMLPIIYTMLELEFPIIVPIFYPVKLYMDVYDYYYIRLSSDNFENYLKDI